jgi:hypothetical protein
MHDDADGKCRSSNGKGDKWVGQSSPVVFRPILQLIGISNTREFNQVGKCRRQQGRDETGVRQTMAYNYAKTNKMPFKFLDSCMGSQEPNWIKNLPANDQKAEVLSGGRRCQKISKLRYD